MARGGDRDDYHDRQVRFGKLNLVYHTSRSFKRGWVALGGRLPVGLLLWALGRLVCKGKEHVRFEERESKWCENDTGEGSST